MTVGEADQIHNFIKLELELHRGLRKEFEERNDVKREFAARVCIYELELLLAYTKHVPRIGGGDIHLE